MRNVLHSSVTVPRPRVTLAVRNALVATCDAGPSDAGLVPAGAVAIADRLIAWVGPDAELGSGPTQAMSRSAIATAPADTSPASDGPASQVATSAFRTARVARGRGAVTGVILSPSLPWL